MEGAFSLPVKITLKGFPNSGNFRSLACKNSLIYFSIKFFSKSISFNCLLNSENNNFLLVSMLSASSLIWGSSKK